MLRSGGGTIAIRLKMVDAPPPMPSLFGGMESLISLDSLQDWQGALSVVEFTSDSSIFDQSQSVSKDVVVFIPMVGLCYYSELST